MLHIQQPPDDCCSPMWDKSRDAGRIADDTAQWVCPDCGCLWLPEAKEGMIVEWFPMPMVEVFR